jgi:uncharacterized membrane protein YdjX (TVP38/TMEM64 family)
MNERRKLGPSVFAFPALFVAMFGVVWIFRVQLYDLFSDPAHVRAAVQRAGVWSPALFVLLQVFQVVVFMVPGEILQIAGGWLFGIVPGSLLSILGISLGSMFDFALARVLGKRFVAGLFGERKLERFDRITTTPRAEAAFFLLFVIPGMPKDVLCFVAGLSTLRPLTFLLVSMLGRVPGIVGSAVMGAAAYEGRTILLVTVAAVAAVLFGLGAIFKDRIHDWIVALRAGASSPGSAGSTAGNPAGGADAGFTVEPTPPLEGDGTPRSSDT